MGQLKKWCNKIFFLFFSSVENVVTESPAEGKYKCTGIETAEVLLDWCKGWAMPRDPVQDILQCILITKEII